MREYLFAQLVDHLIEAQVHLGFNFVVEELLLEVMEGIVTTVAVQVQQVQNVPRVRRGIDHHGNSKNGHLIDSLHHVCLLAF